MLGFIAVDSASVGFDVGFGEGFGGFIGFVVVRGREPVTARGRGRGATGEVIEDLLKEGVELLESHG